MKLTELTERRCAFCNDPFMPKHPSQLYDTADCRIRHDRQVKFERRQAEKAARQAAAATK